MFSLFVCIAQISILCLHLIIHTYIFLWFPELLPYKTAALYLFVVMSFAFTVAMPLSMKIRPYQKLIDTYVEVSSVWLGVMAISFLGVSLSAGVTLLLDMFSIEYSYRVVGISTVATIILANLLGLWNTYHLHRRAYTITDTRLPNMWEGGKIVMIADVHIGRIRRESWVKKVVTAVNRENPDAVLIVGDLYDGPEVETIIYQELLSQINAKRGVFFVNGNHEKYGDLASFKESIQWAGISILEDSSVVLDGLEFVGIDYRTEELYDVPPGRQGIHQVVSRIKESNNPKVYLKHVPMNLGQIACDPNAILSVHGHTHRGQMFPFNFVTSIMYKGYDYGLKKYNDTNIITTSGAGSWGPPQRLYSQSEYVVISLHSK
jgi:predicted MPP superfamily phosphohydrolase